MGDWYPALYGFLVALTFISFIGIWYLKKWGISLFSLIFFTKFSVQILNDDVSAAGIVFSVVVLICLIPYYKKFSDNL
jgi:hypothetical protein